MGIRKPAEKGIGMKAAKFFCALIIVLVCADGIVSAFNSPELVMGFEVPADWSSTTPGVTLGTSSTHTEGSASLSVHPSSSNGWTPLLSLPLGTLAAMSPTVAIDIMLPTQQANPNWLGAVQMYISCPTHNIYNAYLAEVELTGKPLGVWNTLTFPLTGSEAASLLASGYSDLTFTVVLNVAVPTSGIYLFDNLKFLPVTASGCVGQPNGTLCTDGSACTQIDSCRGGVCVGSSPLICDDNNPCTADRCDVTLGCVHSPISCNLRNGRIEAESFDAQNGIAASPTFVTPINASAWVQFNNVNFGSPGTTGRFEAMLLGAANDRHVELHLDSPNGTLVADLLTLLSDPVAPTPQSIDFITAVSGVHNVVVVFKTTDAGSLDWFQLEKALGSDSIATFPPDFHHSNPGQGFPTNVSAATEAPDDIPNPGWIMRTSPLSLPDGQSRVMGIQTDRTAGVVAQARWAGPAGNVTISLLNGQGQILATNTSMAVQGGGTAFVGANAIPAQQIGVMLTNHSGVALNINIRVEAVR